MSVGIPLKIVNGTTQQLATGDNVSANGMEQRSGTALTLGNASTTGIDIGTGVGLTALNIGSGYTGAAQIINVGTSATTGSVINLGSASSEVVVPGTMTVTTTAAFDGATTIGTSPGTDGDTLTVYAMTTFTAGRVTGSIDFKKETAGHALTVVDSTTRAAAGSPLTVRSAAGATDGGVGGVLSLKSGAGGDVVQGTNTSFAASAGTTTFVTPQALFVGGDVGRTIRIAGSTTNNGDFTIASYISPTSVTWATGVGLTEAGAGTWEFTSVLGQAGGAVSMIGGAGGIGSVDLAAGDGGAITISGGTGGAGAVGGSGGALTLTSGVPTGTSLPGVLSIQSGGADILTVDGQGNVVLKTIADDSINTLSLSTGNNSSKGGGAFSVVTGNGGSASLAVGGKISLTAGNGGSGTGADGGSVEITAGNSGSTTGNSGAVTILGGSTTLGGVDGGNVTLTGGTSSAAKAGGVIATTSRTASGVTPTTDGPVLTLTQAAGSASVWVGATSPHGNVSGTQGSLYLKTDGTVYVNTTTGTTWTQLAASGGTSLQSAYDAATPTIALDTSGGIQFNQVDGTNVNAPTLSLTNTEDGAANSTLSVDRSPVTTPAAGYGITVAMGVNATATGLNLVQSGTASGSHGINVNITGPQHLTAYGVGINVQNAGSTGTGLSVTHAGTGPGISVAANGTGIAAQFNASNSPTFGSTVTMANTGTGGGSVLDITGALGHGGISLAAVDAVGVGITMSGLGTGLIVDQTSTGDIALFKDNGSAILTLTGAGAITAEPTSGQNFTVQSKGGATAIALNTTTGVTPTGAITIDSAAGVSIDAATSSNFTVASGAALELTFGAHGSTIDLNTLADPSLVGFTKQSIVGALNELKVGTTAASQIVQTGFDTATNSVTAGMLGYLTTTANRVQKAIATSLAAALVFGANEGTAGSMTTAGTIEDQTVDAGVVLLPGDRLFLSASTAGSVTNVAPSTLTQVVIPVGYSRTGSPVASSGTGDSFASATGTTTLTDAGATWTAADVGRTIVIAGATDPLHNGTFVITAQGGTTVSYLSATPGADQAYAGAWTVYKRTNDMVLAVGSPVVL
jgi:hypothetical protein